MSLAQRIRDFRYAKGWGPDELAGRAGLSRTALYQIESGRTELPRAGTLRRLAEALDTSIEALLAAEGSGPTGRDPRRGPDASPLRGRPKSGAKTEWVPAEGGPLNLAAAHPITTHYDGNVANFAVATATEPTPASEDRARELTRKLSALLDSPLGEGVARIVEESYRMLPLVRSSG